MTGKLNMADKRELIPVDELIAKLRRELPGRVTVVSYEGLKFAVEAGIDCWEFVLTDSFQEVIRDIGTPEQKLRLEAILMEPPSNRCRRTNGTPRAWFATAADAVAFTDNPENTEYQGDVAVHCSNPGCESGWHLSQQSWPDAVAARRAQAN